MDDEFPGYKKYLYKKDENIPERSRGRYEHENRLPKKRKRVCIKCILCPLKM